MKTCPFCAEEIQDAAIKCKHCGEFLIAELRTPPPPPPKPEVPRHFRTNFIITAFCFLGPLALPLLWMHPTASRATKTNITILVLLLTIGVIILFCTLGKMALSSLGEIQKYYNEMLSY